MTMKLTNKIISFNKFTYKIIFSKIKIFPKENIKN